MRHGNGTLGRTPRRGTSGILGHIGLRNCGLGQLVGGQSRACPTPRAPDAAAGGVWQQTALAGYRPSHSGCQRCIARGAGETAYGGTSCRRTLSTWGRATILTGFHGHSGHRLSCGAHLYDGKSLPLYVDFILANLQAELPSLQGIGDWHAIATRICEADALAGMQARGFSGQRPSWARFAVVTP